MSDRNPGRGSWWVLLVTVAASAIGGVVLVRSLNREWFDIVHDTAPCTIPCLLVLFAIMASRYLRGGK